MVFLVMLPLASTTLVPGFACLGRGEEDQDAVARGRFLPLGKSQTSPLTLQHAFAKLSQATTDLEALRARLGLQFQDACSV